MAQGPAAGNMTCSELMIREAEASRARMVTTPGKQPREVELLLSFLHSAYVDEEYLVMGSHLDETIIKKIKNHEYVDFSQLLPRDKIRAEDEGCQRMKLINKNGMTFWSPASNKDSQMINGFCEMGNSISHLLEYLLY